MMTPRQSTLFVAVLAAAFTLEFSSVASAQRRGFSRGPTNGISLIGRSEVQKELKVTDEQAPKLDDLSDAFRDETGELFRGFRDLSADEREAKLEEIGSKSAELADDYQDQLSLILSANQQKRLNQIVLQQRGNRALTDSEVAKQLKLSDEQKQKIESLFEASRQRDRKMRQGVFDATEQERGDLFGKYRDKAKRLREKTDEKAIAVLSEEQKTQFEKLKGEKFELSRRRRGRGRR